MSTEPNTAALAAQLADLTRRVETLEAAQGAASGAVPGAVLGSVDDGVAQKIDDVGRVVITIASAVASIGHMVRGLEKSVADLRVSKPADAAADPNTLRADRFTTDGAYAFPWLDEVWERVRTHGNPDPKAPEGARRIVVATTQLGPRHWDIKDVEVPRAIMAKPLIAAAAQAGIALTEQQRYNIIASDSRSMMAMLAAFGPAFRFPQMERDPNDFVLIADAWSMRVLANEASVEDIKPRLLAAIAERCAKAGITVDLTGI